MSKGLKELKRLAYENACCRCQYYIDNKCTNEGECVWKTIEKELKALEIIRKNAQLSFIEENYGKKEYFIEFNSHTRSEIKTKEEFDLLKEVLL